MHTCTIFNKTSTVVATYTSENNKEKEEELIQLLDIKRSCTFGPRADQDSNKFYLSKFVIFDPDKHENELKHPLWTRQKIGSCFTL